MRHDGGEEVLANPCGNMKTAASTRVLATLVVLRVVGLVSGATRDRPLFVDISEEIGLKNETGRKYWSTTLADVDRNGVYDYVLSDHNMRPVDIYWGNEDFTVRSDDTNPLTIADFHSTTCGDLDNDGVLDCVICKGGGNGLAPIASSVLWGNVNETTGKGYFEKEEEASALGLREGMRGRSVKLLDMNRDGFLDILFINSAPLTPNTARHLVYENVGNRMFRRVEHVAFEAVHSKFGLVLDANDDGIMDVLFLGLGFSLWIGKGNFEFEKDSSMMPDTDLSDVNSAVEFDFNLDGRMDLFLSRGERFGTYGRPDILLKKIRNGYEDVSSQAGVALGGSSVHATDGDFNGDGFPDLFVSRVPVAGVGGRDWILMNQRNGKFKTMRNHSAQKRVPGAEANVAHTVDFDQDGRIDVLVGDRGGRWTMYRNRSIRRKGRNQWIVLRIGAAPVSAEYPGVVHALGALVTAECAGKKFTQRVASKGESHSQSYMDTLTFTFGGRCFRQRGKRYAEVERITVQYVGGPRVEKTGVTLRQTFTIGRYKW